MSSALSKLILIGGLWLPVLGFTDAASAADDWGAIAVDFQKVEKSPYYGVGGGADENEAMANALKFCKEAGGKECKPVTTYKTCGAYAVKNVGGGGWGVNTTKKTAEAAAISACNHDSCAILVSDCN